MIKIPPSNTNLLKKIQKRKKFLSQVVPFVTEITKKLGAITTTVNAWNTEVKGELKNFRDFRFSINLGHSMMGGNDIDVWYKNELVLRAYWQVYDFNPNDEEVKIEFFNKSTEWQSKILEVLKHRESILKDRETAQKQQRDSAARVSSAIRVSKEAIEKRLDSEKKQQRDSATRVLKEAREKQLDAEKKRLGL